MTIIITASRHSSAHSRRQKPGSGAVLVGGDMAEVGGQGGTGCGVAQGRGTLPCMVGHRPTVNHFLPVARRSLCSLVPPYRGHLQPTQSAATWPAADNGSSSRKSREGRSDKLPA